MSSQQRLAACLQSSKYPEPVIVPPRQLPHKHSIILLHGRGDNAKNFAPVLLMMKIPGIGSLTTAFPHARFVFPSAAPRRAQVMKRLPMSQWFDIFDIKRQQEQQELQIEGLRETSEGLHILMLGEIEKVGAENVMLGGLSQGCAASLIASLLWNGPKIAGVIGMCGWLPLRLVLAEAADMEEELDKLDAKNEEQLNLEIHKEMKKHELGETRQEKAKVEFRDDTDAPVDENSAVSQDPASTEAQKVVAGLREYLDLPRLEVEHIPCEDTPLFVGHGWLDHKVPIKLGHRAADFFSVLGTDVSYREYRDLGHWYSPDMLKDVVQFIHQKTTWDQP